MKRARSAWTGTTVVSVTALALVLATGIPAGAVDGNLPGGTSISVTIDTPTDGAVLPPGPVTVTGTAAVGTGQPVANTAVVYVLDVSGSTDAGANSCGRIIDCEIAAARNLNNKIVTDSAIAGTVGSVGAVVFGSTAVAADVVPGGTPDELTTGPDSDLGGTGPDAGDRDIEEVLASAFSNAAGNGGVDDFTHREVEGATDFADAVTRARAVADEMDEQRKIVVFLSDGVATDGADGGVADALVGTPEEVDIYTFAVGSGSSCTDDGEGRGSLQQITAATVPGGQCVEVPTEALPDFLPGIITSELSSLALSTTGPGGPYTPIGNADIQPDLPQAPGPKNVTYSTSTPALAAGTHEICVRAFGSDGGGTGFVTDCTTVVINAPPVVEAGGPYSGQEGTPVGIAGDVTDPDGPPATLDWDVSGGGEPGATCAFGNQAALTTTVTCTDNGIYTLTLTADDGVNPPVEATATLTLTNVAPAVSISAPADGALFTRGTPVSFTAPFTDIGTNDTHTCSVDFDDGSPLAAGTVNEAAGAGTCTISHAFTALGPHNVLVRVTDDDGGSATAVVRVVVYLPGGAFALQATGLLLTIPRTPDVTCPPNDARTSVAVNAPPLLTTGVLNASCTLDPDTGTTTARATVAGANLLGGLVNLSTIESTSVAGPAGITRTSRVVGTINGAAVGTSSPVTIGIPGVAVVYLNESTTNPNGQLVQTAVRVQVLGLLGLPSEEIVLSRSYLG
ncbi:choice-of-anchor P family protein [Plantactinospora sp. CA-294935]|uniref:choice-of-anchor P family protein n=1 Tax=Plantactinospora sp. CA-294935 TaxID=3240012 RepID=UPI003D8CE40A